MEVGEGVEEGVPLRDAPRKGVEGAVALGVNVMGAEQEGVAVRVGVGLGVGLGVRVKGGGDMVGVGVCAGVPEGVGVMEPD